MGSALEKNSEKTRKRIEGHSFDDEDGEEYRGSEFNGFSDYFRRKKIKLQNLDAGLRASSSKPQLFKGVIAHVTGYTQPPLHVLHREIVEHGGGFLQYLDSKTMATHIIASSLPPKKSIEFSRYRIVKPSWITDSITAGKLLPWDNYRVLDEGSRQNVLKFDEQRGLTKDSPQVKQGYREQTDKSFYTNQLKSSSVMSPSCSGAVEQASSPAFRADNPKTQASTSAINKTSSQFKPGAFPPPFKDATTTSSLKNAAPKAATSKPTESLPARNQKPPANATSEEHNAWLLSDPRLRKSSTANPDFLKQFYSESRLHHLSTWKAELKSKMQRMTADNGRTGNRQSHRPSGARRYVMHVDFDSFFCAVSLKKHPEYLDKPAAVAHSMGSGSEIASCNYIARKHGLKNGMWMKKALEMCSELKVLPYDFPAYEEASRQFYECILDVGGIAQSVSVDEALIDVTSIAAGSTQSQGVWIEQTPAEAAEQKIDQLACELRAKIKGKTGCDVSIGIGGNILQAKVALRRAKPAGQYQMKPDDVLAVIGELQVESLPGVAYSIKGKLEDIGATLVKDLWTVSKERLSSLLGPKTAVKLDEYSRGIDRTEVGEQPPRKSVSAEVSWGIRFISQQEAEEFVYNLCKELERRLINEYVRGKQLTMKIMRRALDAPLDPAKHLGHGKCDTFNKSTTFGVATNNYETLGKEAVSILRSFKFSPGDLRGLGVQMTKLEPIKANVSSAPEGSQRKLNFDNFKDSTTNITGKRSRVEGIEEAETEGLVNKPNTYTGTIEDDPIAEDPLTPRKQRVHPAMALARAGQADTKATTPLNISGTQFIIPSNADPAILAELPNDIRSKLTRMKDVRTEPKLPSKPTVSDLLPLQVDAEVFNALPEDMKAEILQTYGRNQHPPITRPSPKKEQQQLKRGTTKSLFGKKQRQKDAQAGLVQTHVNGIRTRTTSEPPLPQHDPIQDLDPEFLSELPEDVRNEVIQDHLRRRQQAQRHDALVSARRQHTGPSGPLPLLPGGGQRRIKFPAAPAKISFASLDVTSMREVKDMLDAWHSETKQDGPHRGDVDVFERYLMRVVLEERDLEKVGKLVKWIGLLVENNGGEELKGQTSWMTSLESIKSAVQKAMEQRGLGPMNI